MLFGHQRRICEIREGNDITVISYTLQLNSIIQLFAKAGLKLAIKWMEFCMSDNIRNKTIFEAKIAKIAKKNYQNLTFWRMTPTLYNEDVFANTTKNFSDSRMYSYWDIDRTKLKFQKWFLAKTSKFEFWFFVAQLQLVCYLGKKFENSTFKILGDIARTREVLRTDGRPIYICLPQGGTYNKSQFG